ncbi:MAG: hypothetical protein LBD74_02550 [Spirochaetaceae bacterium]|jgi:hypothetical protein|nr:hypothetical protein [Spirochaetaceae bacterium]
MKFFLCTFDTISLGIPSEVVEEILQVPPELPGLIEMNPIHGDVFLSLPHLCRQGEMLAPHGIRLKPLDYPEGAMETLKAYTGIQSPRIILVTTVVETEVDVPDEAIRELPRFFGISGKLSFLKGLTFTDAKMLACIDPVLLVSRFIDFWGH